jgi:hypothetical protein
MTATNIDSVPFWANTPLRLFFKGISFVFHPLFIPSFVTAFLLWEHPNLFAGFQPLLKIQRLVTVFFNTAFIPGFGVFLMWRLKLVPSMQLRTAKDRIIPYASAIIFYFWAWYVLSRQHDSPELFVNFLQGTFFGVCGAWIININSKISMHTTAMGGMVAFFIVMLLKDNEVSPLYLALAFLTAGLVGTARLMVSDHSRLEINQGYIIGALTMLLAFGV